MSSENNFDLIGNAKDSLEHAVDHLTKTNPPSPNDLKRAILDVTHVLELILKESLQRIHPAFVWEKIDDFPDEEKRTVTTELAVQRLTKIGGVVFSKRTLNGIGEARKIRNKIEHFKFTLDEKMTRIIIGRLLSLIFNFAKKNLSLNWEDEFKNSSKWKVLIKDVNFYREHVLVVQKRMEEEKIKVFVCLACGGSTFNLKSGLCELCGHKESTLKCDQCDKEYPRSYVNVFQDEENDDVLICTTCYSPDFDEDRDREN